MLSNGHSITLNVIKCLKTNIRQHLITINQHSITVADGDGRAVDNIKCYWMLTNAGSITLNVIKCWKTSIRQHLITFNQHSITVADGDGRAVDNIKCYRMLKNVSHRPFDNITTTNSITFENILQNSETFNKI